MPVFIGEGGPEGKGDLSADPIRKFFPHVMEATDRVLVANGDLDLEILRNSTLLPIQNMTWGDKLEFQLKPWKTIIISLPDLTYEEVFDENGFHRLDYP